MKWIARSIMGCVAVVAASQLANAQYPTLATAEAMPSYREEQTAVAANLNYSSMCTDDVSCNNRSNCGLFKNTTFGGWVQGGWMGNTRGDTGQNPFPGNVGQGTTGNTDIVLNQAWLFGEKSIDKYSCGWDWGWRADFAYGSDMPGWQTYNDIGDPAAISNHNNIQSFDYGWLTGGGGGPNGSGSVMYGAAMPQLYATVKYNRLSAKVGHFLSPMGYESLMATSDRNYFYSHSYAFNYLSPHTLTGALGEFAVCRDFSVFAGWANGWDNGFGFGDNDGSVFIGGVKINPTKNLELNYMLSAGDLFTQNVAGIGSVTPNGYYHSIMVDWKISRRLNYGLESTLGSIDVAGTSNWWTVANYLNLKLNCKWSTALRFEYADMSDPFFSMSPFVKGGSMGVIPPVGYGDVYSLTWGFTWKPCTSHHLAIRPELRYDWVDAQAGTSDLFSGGIGATYAF